MNRFSGALSSAFYFCLRMQSVQHGRSVSAPRKNDAATQTQPGAQPVAVTRPRSLEAPARRPRPRRRCRPRFRRPRSHRRRQPPPPPNPPPPSPAPRAARCRPARCACPARRRSAGARAPRRRARGRSASGAAPPTTRRPCAPAVMWVWVCACVCACACACACREEGASLRCVEAGAPYATHTPCGQDHTPWQRTTVALSSSFPIIIPSNKDPIPSSCIPIVVVVRRRLTFLLRRPTLPRRSVALIPACAIAAFVVLASSVLFITKRYGIVIAWRAVVSYNAPSACDRAHLPRRPDLHHQPHATQ